jgi:3-oxoacyl-[acyl-carrier protein] reductase
MARPTRAALITGAGGGIGLAMCRAFAAAGFGILAVDIDAAAAETAVAAVKDGGGDAAHLACDVADPGDVERLRAWAVEERGGVDVVCNNAGIFDGYESAVDTTPELWARVLGVNLTGPFLISRALIPSIAARGGGAIVNTASIAGMVAGAGGVAYTATKHGVVGLTRQLAQECGALGIRVNAIAPGVIATGMSMQLIEEPSRNDFTSSMIERTPAGRLGRDDEVARLAVYLASEDAAFIQGALVPIDGGWTAI